MLDSRDILREIRLRASRLEENRAAEDDISEYWSLLPKKFIASISTQRVSLREISLLYSKSGIILLWLVCVEGRKYHETWFKLFSTRFAADPLIRLFSFYLSPVALNLSVFLKNDGEKHAVKFGISTIAKLCLIYVDSLC